MQTDEDEFIREPLTTARSVVQSNRRRTMRWALLAIGGCVLLAVTILASTGTTGQLWRQARFAWLEHTAPILTRATITPHAPGQRALPGGWQPQPAVAFPASNVHWYTPAPNDPQTFYACSAAQTGSQGYQEDGPLTFWYTHDAGQRWSSVRMPQTLAFSCDVTGAADAPERLGLIGQYQVRLSQRDVGCAQVNAFLSSDGGAHWHAVPALPNTPAPADSCNVHLWLSARHLFLFYDIGVLAGKPSNQTTIQRTSLARSDDGGQTWQRLDENHPQGSDEFYPTLLDDGETLLLRVNQVEPSANGTPEHVDCWLWVSRDAGESWEPLAHLENLGVQSILSSGADALAPSQASPLYLVNEASQSSRRYRIQIAQVSDLHHWTPLPPLPIAGASPEHLGITTVLAETASGKLLVFGLGPNAHVPSDHDQQSSLQKIEKQWLWEWDPQASRWMLLAPALAAPWPEGCSDHCWSGALTPGVNGVGTYLSVRGYYFSGEQLDIRMFRARLPDTL